jgi:hypothetical protein
MNYHSFHEIRNRNPTNKELYHPSRNRKGYHVFISQCYADFKKLTEQQQQEQLAFYHIWIDNDEVSVDSVMTPSTFNHVHIMKLCNRLWTSASDDVRNGWKCRAEYLNMLPRKDGRFDSLHQNLHHGSLTSNILESLSYDWIHLCKTLNTTICRSNTTKVGESIHKTYKFGNQKVFLLNQIYKSFHFNYLLRLICFGSNYQLLSTHEKVLYSSNESILHFHSWKRIQLMFNHSGINPFCKFIKLTGSEIIVTAKVSWLDIENKESIGYVIDESADHIKVQCIGNSNDQITIIELDRPVYENNEYKFSELSRIKQYWPLMMKLNNNGQCSVLMNRIGKNCSNESNNLMNIN